MKFIKMLLIMSFSLILLAGCTKAELQPTEPSNAKITADVAELKTIGTIKSAVLSDLEGNVIQDTFDTEQLLALQEAYNSSVIQDTAYIEMITGYTLTLTLEDDSTRFISSYGNPDYVVASSSLGGSYHLMSETLGQLLLNKLEY